MHCLQFQGISDALANSSRVLENDDCNGGETIPNHEIVNSVGNMEPTFSEMKSSVTFCETIISNHLTFHTDSININLCSQIQKNKK